MPDHQHGGLRTLLPYMAHKLTRRTTHGLKQIFSDPTIILPQSSSCIDFIFTDQPNYVTDCGTHPSLHPNCHHQITFCKLNFEVEFFEFQKIKQ